jgi:hypothetical protein
MRPEAGDVAIDVALHLTVKDFDKLAVRDALGEARISLLQCVALTPHLGSIAAAAGRAISKGWLRSIRVPIIGCADVTEGGADATIVVQATAELFQMQMKLAKMLAPGIVTTAIPTISLHPIVKSERFAPFTAHVVSASIYEVETQRVLWKLDAT